MGVTAAIAAVAVAGGIGAMAGSSMAKGNKPDMPAPPPSAGQADVANENEAQKAAERRRRMYSNMGRSSTILTGPGGLGSAPTGDTNSAPKQLLGL